MKIEISDKIIKKWEKDSEEGVSGGPGEKIKLTPKKLKEMVKEFLQDYFS